MAVVALLFASALPITATHMRKLLLTSEQDMQQPLQAMRSERPSVDDLIAYVENRWKQRRKTKPRRNCHTTCVLLLIPTLGAAGFALTLMQHPPQFGFGGTHMPPMPYGTEVVPYYNPPSQQHVRAVTPTPTLFTVSCDREIATHFMRALPGIAYAMAQHGGRGQAGVQWGGGAIWQPPYGWTFVAALSLATWCATRLL